MASSLRILYGLGEIGHIQKGIDRGTKKIMLEHPNLDGAKIKDLRG